MHPASRSTHLATPTRTHRGDTTWLASTRSRERATSASWPTSTRARPRRPSASSTTRASTTRSARSTRAPRPWTTWSRSRSAGSRSPRPRPTASGRPSRARYAGVIAPHQHHRHARPRRLHDRGRAHRCASSTARSRCSTAATASSRRRETVWRQADKYRVPRIAFINKMDKVGADFQMCVNIIKERLGANPVPIQWPLGEEDQHKGIIDLIKMKAADLRRRVEGPEVRVGRDPRRPQGQVATEWRDKLIEACADVDDEIMAKLPRRQGRRGHRRDDPPRRSARDASTSSSFPVICGSAFKNKGVQLLLDAVVNYLPSPLDIPPVKGIDPSKKDKPEIERKATDDEPFTALAFKIINDPHGNLTFFRVYSGKVASGTMVLELDARQARAHRPHPAHAREQARGAHGGRRGQHLRGRRPPRHAHGRHALRREATRSSSRR